MPWSPVKHQSAPLSAGALSRKRPLVQRRLRFDAHCGREVPLSDLWGLAAGAPRHRGRVAIVS